MLSIMQSIALVLTEYSSSTFKALLLVSQSIAFGV